MSTELPAVESNEIKSSVWRPIETAPTNGTRFDVWCKRHPDSKIGVRFTDVQMRGDNSGFGFVSHTAAGVVWHYLGREDEVYPSWTPTHWMPRPSSPDEVAETRRTESAGSPPRAGFSDPLSATRKDAQR